jgi:hypothetical protein
MFHIHGECAPGASVTENVTIHVSTLLANNPEAADPLARMGEIFRDEVAGTYGTDWLSRSVREGYLPAKVMSPPSSPVKRAGTSQQNSRPAADTPKARMVPFPSPTLSTISTTSSLMHSAVASHNQHSPPSTPNAKTRRMRTSAHSQFPAPPSPIHETKPSTLSTMPPNVQPNHPSHQQSPALLTLSSTVTLSGTMGLGAMTSGTISHVMGSRLPNDIEDFMVDIGRDDSGARDIVRDIYLFTGRALWESSIMGRMGLSPGFAKALVSLMSATS